MDFFWTAPPVTRTLAAAIFVPSLLVGVMILDPGLMFYDSTYILKFPPEIWRLVSSFLITFKMGIIMDPYFIWTYGAPLETSSSRFNSAKFLVYIVFLSTVILFLAGEVLGAYMFIGPLSLAITYTFTQENRNQMVQFFFFTIDVKWLVWARLLATLVLAGPYQAMIDAVGIPAAHLYDFLTVYWPEHGGGFNPIVTPQFLTSWFYGAAGPRHVEAKGHGTSFQARGPRANPNPGYSNAWGSRGQGQRLGGE